MTALIFLAWWASLSAAFVAGCWWASRHREPEPFFAEPIGFADVDHDFLAHRESAQ